MATWKEEGSCEKLMEEFAAWQTEILSDSIFLLEPLQREDGGITLSLLLECEFEFKLLCPKGYPDYEEHFYVEADPSVTLWGNAVNEFLLDAPCKLTLKEVLSKAASLYTNDCKKKTAPASGDTSDEEMSIEEEEEVEEEEIDDMMLSDDDSAFTTEWELTVARKKKRWTLKEQKVRDEMNKAKLAPGASEFGAIQASNQEKDQAKQIFTSTAASGILTNDLVRIMECEDELGFMAEPLDDNIYQWCVKIFRFDPYSGIADDVKEVKEKFGYKYIQLEVDFAIDLYPFYPPLVKVIRPRLQGSMMQRVTNMEMLKLSYWNPTKDMKSVLVDIKHFLEQWARLEVNSERNDPKRFPSGSYVEIEHHLLRLALVSEVNPRANCKYHMDIERPPKVKPPQPKVEYQKDKKKKVEYWAAGTGYGHNKRPEWDIKAYVAAQREKDKQVEAVLHKILHELKILYANHAPQLKPRTVKPESSAGPAECVDPVEDMYNIIEGSALVPFLEQYLKADSFLEICRHTSVYKVIVDIIKELAMQPQLIPLLCSLPDQPESLYQLLQKLENKAAVLLQHICKAGNGSIPKPPKKVHGKKGKEKCVSAAAAAVPLEDFPSPAAPSTSTQVHAVGSSSSSMENTAEEKLAREFVTLFKDVTESLRRQGMLGSNNDVEKNSEIENMDVTLSPDQEAAIEARYKKAVKELQFDSHDIDVEGPSAHHYANDFRKNPNPSQTQVFRIAQELTSLSSSLPLGLSSSIFVRTDDDKLTLMRALITGPEGTPYSGGCFQFDIFFPSQYPKVPPIVNLQTTGGGTVRFNPNLYNCGKVCLSLLGTWEGQQGEQWNETTSTVLQVLVSIQSLILVAEPYFNEPGYEQEIGTEAGKRHSADYNTDVQVNCIKYAIVSQLQNPSPGFEDVINTHFYLKRERLIQEAEGWVRNSKSSKLERAVQNLKTELKKLQVPQNLTNLANSGKNNLVMDSPQI